jgi:TM2 domain-containing membrane protein YozV
MASEVLCGRCGAMLSNPMAPCPRCGAAASGSWQYTRPASRKDPRVAALLAVIPGMGHFYLGHNMKGVGFLAGILGMQFFGFDLDLSMIGAAIGVPLELGGGTLWVYSIVDAYRTAKHMDPGPQPGPNFRT